MRLTELDVNWLQIFRLQEEGQLDHLGLRSESCGGTAGSRAARRTTRSRRRTGCPGRRARRRRAPGAARPASTRRPWWTGTCRWAAAGPAPGETAPWARMCCWTELPCSSEPGTRFTEISGTWSSGKVCDREPGAEQGRHQSDRCTTSSTRFLLKSNRITSDDDVPPCSCCVLFILHDIMIFILFFPQEPRTLPRDSGAGSTQIFYVSISTNTLRRKYQRWSQVFV